MAVLCELFLVLAGFESGVSQQNSLHPAEAELFQLAEEFGKSVYKVRHRTSQIDHPVSNLIRREVVIPYLSNLARLEANTVSQLKGNVRVPLANSLRYSTRIMAQTVSGWTQKFDFALEILKRLAESLLDCHKWLSYFIDLNAGNEDLRKLGLQCIQALDKQWVIYFRDFICGEINGIESHPIIENETNLNEDASKTALSKCLREGANSLSDQAQYLRSSILQLKDAAYIDLTLLESLLKLSEHLRIQLEIMELPLTSEKLAHSLADCQLQVSRVVWTHCIQSTEAQNLLVLLRNVVLCGSVDFKDQICETNGDYEFAISKYLGSDRDISSDVRDLGVKILAVKNRKLRIYLSNRSHLKLRFLLSKDQCTIYENIFEWLVCILLARAKINFGDGNVANKNILFLNELWCYYQECIDTAMLSVAKCLQHDCVSIHREHDIILKKLIRSLFLDSDEYRKLLLDLTSANSSADNEPLGRLVNVLMTSEENAHCINLAPFQLST